MDLDNIKKLFSKHSNNDDLFTKVVQYIIQYSFNINMYSQIDK